MTIFLALFVLIMRGTASEGQASFFSEFLKGYIEETSASVATAVRLPNANTYYINNLAKADLQSLGQGGEAVANPTPDLSLVQQSSVMSSSPASEDSALAIGKRSQVIEYTVQDGDAISFIASDYGVSVNSILWANNIKDADSIKPGQVLKIPPVTGVVYTVKRGDTITSLAKRFQADQDKILSFNGLSADASLKVGSTLVLPDGQIGATVTPYPGEPKRAVENGGRFSYLPNLSSYFILPTTGYDWGIIHGRNGVDVANSCGTPVYAAANGNVAIAQESGWNGGYGRYLKLVHPNGTETLYAHLSKKYVFIGDSITQGQLIGLIGTTGHSTGCHLHFEVHGAKNPFAK